MIKSRIRIPLYPVLLVAAAIAIIALAAVTSWWVLLALFPLAMAVGCVEMMAAGRRMLAGSGAARRGCCILSAVPTDAYRCRSLRSERTAAADG